MAGIRVPGVKLSSSVYRSCGRVSREITKQLASHPILKDLSCAIKEAGRAILKGKGKAAGDF